jgi:hypothetical protein
VPVTGRASTYLGEEIHHCRSYNSIVHECCKVCLSPCWRTTTIVTPRRSHCWSAAAILCLDSSRQCVQPLFAFPLRPLQCERFGHSISNVGPRLSN